MIERLIDESLEDTTVTVICITQGTGASELVNQQIDRSLARGNGLVAVRIHRVKDADGNATELGASPPQIENSGYQTYDYRKPASLAKWIEAAAKRAGH